LIRIETKYCKKIFVFFVFLIIVLEVNTIQAQDMYIKVRDIVVEGNKRTQQNIITRELNFEKCDSILAGDLQKTLDQNKLQVFNLGIFNRVSFNIKNWENDSLDIYIEVIEKMNILPIPIFKFIDRNVNEWWREFDHDFKRIQYGATLVFNNFRGRNEKFRITTTFGFAQVLDAYYKFPQIGKTKGLGLVIHSGVMRTKRFAFYTDENILQYYYADKYIKKNFNIGAKIIYRSTLKSTHTIDLNYNYNYIDLFTAFLNPNYFLNSRNRQQYIAFNYDFIVDRRNIINYPTKGWYVQGGLESFGLGFQKNVALLSLYMQGSKFFSFANDKLSSGHFAKAYTSYPSIQPYNIQRALGYEKDAIRGYELRVIDGQHFVLTKHELRYKLFQLNVQNTKVMKKIPLTASPMSIMLKAYFDAGYVKDDYYSRNNPLNNTLLYGYGVGIDLVTYNDSYFRIEYSFNKQKQKGLYLHFDMPL
jgi:outer membrane protein assembly factor BamA